MSFWVYLCNPETGVPLELAEAHEEGGTYALGGTTEAGLNVTYNYSSVYRPHGFNLRDLDGKTARETTPDLERVIAAIGTVEPDNNYWAPTPGNAGRALHVLARWGRELPHGVWAVH